MAETRRPKPITIDEAAFRFVSANPEQFNLFMRETRRIARIEALRDAEQACRDHATWAQKQAADADEQGEAVHAETLALAALACARLIQVRAQKETSDEA